MVDPGGVLPPARRRRLRGAAHPAPGGGGRPHPGALRPGGAGPGAELRGRRPPPRRHRPAGLLGRSGLPARGAIGGGVGARGHPPGGWPRDRAQPRGAGGGARPRAPGADHGDAPMSDPGVAHALLAYGDELAETDKTGIVVAFTPNEEANRFVLDNPNAFLFAVIFDQGIQAERAWAAPYFLSQRLGHFDLALIASMIPSELSEVVARPPALHRSA